MNRKKFRMLFLLGMILVFSVYLFLPSNSVHAAKRRSGTETIRTKSQLMKSFNRHLLRLDSKFSYRVPLSIADSSDAFAKVLLDALKYSSPASEVYEHSYRNSRFVFKVVGNHAKVTYFARYSKPKRELRKLISKLKKQERLPLLSSVRGLKRAFLKKYYNLDKTFYLKIDKNVMTRYYNDFNGFLYDMSSNPKYNDLTEKIKLSFQPAKYSDFYLIKVILQTNIDKNGVKRILKDVTPMIRTKQELVKAIVKNTDRLKERFSLNIASDVLDFDDKEDYNKLWDTLYRQPEFYDLSSYTVTPQFQTLRFNGYNKWTWKLRYDIHKQDLDYLKKYVKSWVASHITPSMTEEEKVRTINDFMVKEFRYTFGDRGQLHGAESGNEKLGRHSVYTCFALVFGKGGVCNSKANMFYRLAREAGLAVLYVSGKGNGEDHAWNMVRVDGNWYHLDNTWNRGQYEGGDENSYYNTRKYYLKSDSSMSEDHSWDGTLYPKAPHDYPWEIPVAKKNSSLSSLKAA